MKKRWISVILAVIMTLGLFVVGCKVDGNGGATNDKYVDYSADKQPGGDQFDFPGNYEAPELKIDGKDDDLQWAGVKTLVTFGHDGAATIKVYRGEKALFFFAEVKDPILATEGEANDDTVTRSDSIEIYIDTLADGGTKPQSDDYQINLGIHGKTRIMQGSGSGWGGWNGLIDYEVQLDGVLNDGFEATDVGYTVEVMIPYAQIGIEKDDTVAVSFGQVDKFANGSSSGAHWDWFGWELMGWIVEPQTPNNYVLLDKDNNLISRDEEARPNADMAGYVVDFTTEQPLAGVTVSVEGESMLPVVTDAQGYFVFEKVNPEKNYTLKFAKDGYFGNSEVYTRSELREANGGRVLKHISLRDEDSVAKTTVKGVVKNLIEGAIGGATVSVDGTSLSATTADDGSFEIAGVPAEIDVTLTVSKLFYGESKNILSAELLVADGISEIGDVNLNLAYALTEGFGNKSAAFADSSMKIARALTGVEMLLSGTRMLSGNVEVYLDVKESADHRDNDATMWRFDLRGDGSIGVDNYAAEGAGTATGLEYTLYNNDSTGYSARLFIPYSYMGIEPLEVFGISLGQWSTTANDWDGWGYNGQFIAPEKPTEFVRVSATNELYREITNSRMVTLSGNVGVQGVKVEIGEFSTVTGAQGGWSLRIPATNEEIDIVYSRLGYLSHTTTVEAGYFATNQSYEENVELELQKVSVGGTVVDEVGKPIANANVEISGSDLSAITDANGQYVIENVGTFSDILILVTKDGYTSKEISLSAITLAGASSHEANAELTSLNQVRYITLNGKITNVNGPVSGATVTLEGNSEVTATTLADGTFSIADFGAIDGTLIVTKAGYETARIEFLESAVADDATSFDVGEHDMWLAYTQLHGFIADKADTFAHFTGYVTRSATGIEFKFVGTKAFAGRIELFVDTKTSAGDNARDTSDYLFNLNSDGTIQIVNWGEGTKNETVPSNMKLTVVDADTAPVVTFTLPYAFFGQRDVTEVISATEVIGISAGQWSTIANDGAGDWDGWDNQALWGANGAAFVKPEMPTDYIRIGAHNEVYNHINNDTLNLHEYQINFGTSYTLDGAPAGAKVQTLADNFHAKVSSRNESGVTFDFITTGDFSKNGSENEMVLVYFDTSDTVNGWDNVNYLIKIASDGTVYGKVGSWWSATDADKIGEVVITRENGVTTFSLTVAYSTLGISATDVFGVAMRECSHNASDHGLYDPWWDCYFEAGTSIGANGIDAANSDQYIRVAADGSLYRANNNN